MELFSENRGAIGISLVLSFLFVCSVNSEEISKNNPKKGANASSVVNNKEKEGKKIHLRILNKYKKVDKYYRSPHIWGALTEAPLSMINIPIREWEILSKKEREYLSIYAASTVRIVKTDPLKYSGIPKNAPAAPIILKNVANMNQDSWCINVGRIGDDGSDIMLDKIIRSVK